MKQALALVALVLLAGAPAFAQSSTEDVDALRRALEQALRENISLRADLEAARAEIDRLRGGAERPLALVPTAPIPASRTHTVKEGETLGILAARYYGTVNLYSRIYEANRSIVSNPNLIYPGQQLVIP